jgi:hypothetical protein
MKAMNKKIVTPQPFARIGITPIKHHVSPLGARNMVGGGSVIDQGVKSTQVVSTQVRKGLPEKFSSEPKRFDYLKWAKRFLRHLPKVAVASLLAGCVFDTGGVAYIGDDGGQGDGDVPDTGMPDAGDAETIDPDAAQDAGDAETDAETPIDDRPTLTWPQLPGLPNNRVFVRWDAPQQIPAGKTIVAYEVTLTVGMSTSTKEVTNTFTALDIVSPNTMYRISVRARYNDNSYSQPSTEKTVVTDSSLLARYTMDEGAGGMVGDSSANGNHGSLVNFNLSTAWTQGMINTGLLCDGVDDYVDVDDSANPGQRFDFDSTEAFTIEAWVKRSVVGNQYPTIFAKADYTNTSFQTGYWLGYTPTNELYLGLVSESSANDQIIIETSTQYDATNIPQSVAVSYDGSLSYLGAQIYVDGAVQQINQSTYVDNLTGSILNPAPGRIGAAVGLGGTFADVEWPMEGPVDEVAVYEGAKSGGTIRQNHCARKNGSQRQAPTRRSGLLLADRMSYPLNRLTYPVLVFYQSESHKIISIVPKSDARCYCHASLLKKEFAEFERTHLLKWFGDLGPNKHCCSGRLNAPTNLLKSLH